MSRSLSPANAYCLRLLQTTTTTSLTRILQDAPISEDELDFILDVQKHMSLKNLSQKYKLTVSGIAKKKHTLFERIHKFDVCRLTR